MNAPQHAVCGAGERREGPSFPLFAKLLASALVATLLAWAVRMAGEVARAGLSGGGLVFLASVFIVIGATWWAMLRSRTEIDDRHIRQRWLWTKEVALADITQLKLIDLPLLSWLIAPRLMVRARGRLGVFTFHAAGTEVLAAFRDLAHGREPRR